MKSWIFSDNDQTTQPLSGNDAFEYVALHPNAYAWRPSYTHWIPVNHIAEFADVVKTPKAPSVIPQDLIESFIVKERALVEKLSSLDGKIVTAINSLAEFEEEVNYYKELTKDCNLDVQETLDNIERQYARLKENLKSFTQTAATSKKQMNSTVDDFKKSTSASELTSASESSSTEEALADEPAEPAPAPKAVKDETVSKPEIEVSELDVEATEPDIEVTESETISIEDEPPLQTPEPKHEEPQLSVVPERVVKNTESVSSSTANKAAAAVSELVSDAPVESVSKPKPKPKKVPRVEFSEDITQEDLAIAAKIQSMTVDADMPQSYDKNDMANSSEGDFDYILNGKYVDDGSIGQRVDASNDDGDLDEELVTEVDDNLKKRRRRRRR